MKYHKHIEKNGPIFFSINQNEQVNGSAHMQEVLDEIDDDYEKDQFSKIYYLLIIYVMEHLRSWIKALIIVCLNFLCF